MSFIISKGAGYTTTWTSLDGDVLRTVAYKDGTKFNYKNDKKHKNEGEGPAAIIIDSISGIETREWWLEGQRHRSHQLPSVVKWNSKTSLPTLHKYYSYGKLENLNGPAVVSFNDKGDVVSEKWYIDGREYEVKEDFKKAIKLLKLKKLVKDRYIDYKPYKTESWSDDIVHPDNVKLICNHLVSPPKIEVSDNSIFANNTVDGSSISSWDKYIPFKIRGKALGNSWKFSEKGGRLIEKHNINYLHCDDGPALVYPNGRKEWWYKGKRHREDGPAIERPSGRKEFWIDGERWTKKNFNKRLKVNTNKIQTWSVSESHIKAKIHDGHLIWHPIQESIIIDCKDGPALQDSFGSSVWLHNNLAHREGGEPAVIIKDSFGNIQLKEWRIGGVLHRDDGPALEEVGPEGTTKIWFKNGIIHRDKGPAIELPNGDKVYYMNGVAMDNLNIEASHTFKQIEKDGFVGYLCKTENPSKDKWIFFALGDTVLSFSAEDVYSSELHNTVSQYNSSTYHDYFISEDYGERIIDSISSHGLRATADKLLQEVTDEQCAIADKVTTHEIEDYDEGLEDLEDLESLEDISESDKEIGWGGALGAVLAAAVVKGIVKSKGHKNKKNPQTNSAEVESTVEEPDCLEV